MESNDFDFESDYDPQEDPEFNSAPPFESGDSEDTGLERESDDFGAALDASSWEDIGEAPVQGNVIEDVEPYISEAPKMKKVIKQRNWKTIALLSLVFGIALGIVYGYLINPIEWVDAGLYHLRYDLQEDYVRAVVDSFELTDDGELALRRLNELRLERSAEILAIIGGDPGSQNIDKIQQLSALVSSASGGGQLPVDDSGISNTPVGDEGGEDEGGGFSTLYLVCIVLVLALVVIAIILYLRKRSAGGEASDMSSPSIQAQDYSSQAAQTNYAMGGESQPISQWMTTYLIGDDLFDDSFSIDTPSGEFMGECGVGIADTIGVGEPKRVGAFEIWLFDKNDIQTVTKVLMSEHAFSDESISGKLSAKGDPEMALSGHEIVLETATLQMIARVVDMTYGAGSLPDNSFFERMTIELAVWQK